MPLSSVKRSISDNMRLSGIIIVITGAGSGIGRATAVLFARKGALVVCIDSNETDGRETLRLISEQSPDSFFIRADIGKAGEVKRAALVCRKRISKIDVLFNNAGAVIWQTFEKTTWKTWSMMLATNLSGVFLCSKYFLPLIKISRNGSIVNHASVDALHGNPNVAAYSAAKGGIIPLTHVMAHDLGRYRIRVNSICSGGIATPMRGPVNQETIAKSIAATPAGRAGTPDEVARVVLFLATQESSYINGANLIVDGGRTAITRGIC